MLCPENYLKEIYWANCLEKYLFKNAHIVKLDSCKK